MKLILFGEDIREGVEIDVDDNGKMEEVMVKVLDKLHNGQALEELEIFIEDADSACERAHHNKHPGFKHFDRIHCHQCQKIEVVFAYNGTSHNVKVAPGTTGEKLLGMVPGLFKNISPKDAANLRLEYAKDLFVEKSEHIGSFVKYPECHIKIDLVTKTNVQG